MVIPSVLFANGNSVPSFGYGTNSTETEKYGDVESAVKIAIDSGYRYFDTSCLYWNESEVGNAIRFKISERVVSRSDIFVVNKIWCTFDKAEKIEEACRKSLENLGLTYLDLCLLHIPSNFAFSGDQVLFPIKAEPKIDLKDVDYVEAWRSMAKLVALGLTKNIGVSNCNATQLRKIIDLTNTKPVSNHIECCPGLHQKSLIKFCKKWNILVTAYCPLGRPDFQRFTVGYNNNQDVMNICSKYRKTSSQLILRYLYQLGTIPVPKSITKSRIEQYINIFDFEMSEVEMAIIDSFYKDERLVVLENVIGQKRFPITVKKISIGSGDN